SRFAMRRLNSGTKALAKAPSANSRRKMFGSWKASCQASATPPAPSARASSMSRAKPNRRLTMVSPPIVPTFLSRLMLPVPFPLRLWEGRGSSGFARRNAARGGFFLPLLLQALRVEAVEVDRVDHQRLLARVAARIGEDAAGEGEQQAR